MSDSPSLSPSEIFIGIDVSKATLDGCVGATLVVFEATGGYERPLADALGETEIPWTAVNPRTVRDFARAAGRPEPRSPTGRRQTDGVGVGVFCDVECWNGKRPLRHIPHVKVATSRRFMSRLHSLVKPAGGYRLGTFRM